MLEIEKRLAISKIILKPFTVRVHTGLARKPWARLWYLSRGFDSSGRGIVDLPAEVLCQILSVSKPTLYEWLRDGKKAGAFRRYQFKQNCCRIWLGSLHKLCKSLGLDSWGATATVSLLGINQLREFATVAVTADLQDKSHFAARRNLKKGERPFFTPPSADTILAQAKVSSQEPAQGQVPFLLWVGQSKAFVSKGFVPFGASQRSIAISLGISERTVRRHQGLLGLERRQMVQAKAAYQLIDAGIEWEAERCYAEPDIYYQQFGNEIRLFEPNGITSSRQEAGNLISRERLFRYAGKTWIYRCNLYGVAHIELTSMRASRREFQVYLDNFVTSTAGGASTEIFQAIQDCPDPPGKGGQNT